MRIITPTKLLSGELVQYKSTSWLRAIACSELIAVGGVALASAGVVLVTFTVG